MSFCDLKKKLFFFPHIPEKRFKEDIVFFPLQISEGLSFGQGWDLFYIEPWVEIIEAGVAGSRHIAYWVHIAYCILSAALSTASSFRIWNSSAGILSLPGAGAPPMAKVMRKEARHTQRQDRASGVPLEILEHLLPNQSLPTFCFVLSPTPLTLQGAVPHYLSLKKELAYSSS